MWCITVFEASKEAAKISLEQAAVFSKEQTHEMLVVDELLTRLASFDPQGGRIVELRFYGGLSVEEAAEVMSISSAKVKREWSVANGLACTRNQQVECGRGGRSKGRTMMG